MDMACQDNDDTQELAEYLYIVHQSLLPINIVPEPTEPGAGPTKRSYDESNCSGATNNLNKRPKLSDDSGKCSQKWLDCDDIVDKEIFSSDRYTEYSTNILDTLHEREQNLPLFYDRSSQTNYRPLLIDLIRKFAKNHELSRAAVHLGIYLMDNFMDTHVISVERIYIFSLVCLTLGAKIEDTELKTPKINEICEHLNDTIKYDEYLHFEKTILSYFHWQIILPTAVTFFEFYIEAICDDTDYQLIIHTQRFDTFSAMKLAVIERAIEFLDLTLNESLLMQNIKPSIVAASCLAAARESLNIGEMWTMKLERLTRYTINEIKFCVSTLLQYRSQAIYSLSAKSNKTNESGYITEEADDDDNDLLVYHHHCDYTEIIVES